MKLPRYINDIFTKLHVFLQNDPNSLENRFIYKKKGFQLVMIFKSGVSKSCNKIFARNVRIGSNAKVSKVRKYKLHTLTDCSNLNN